MRLGGRHGTTFPGQISDGDRGCRHTRRHQYLYADGKLSPDARGTIERAAAGGNQVGFSAITLAEIVYLTKKGRIQSDTYTLLLSAMRRQDVVLAVVPFDETVAGYLHQQAF